MTLIIADNYQQAHCYRDAVGLKQTEIRFVQDGGDLDGRRPGETVIAFGPIRSMRALELVITARDRGLVVHNVGDVCGPGQSLDMRGLHQWAVESRREASRLREENKDLAGRMSKISNLSAEARK